ncbi:MAG TPA: hypothetical protein DEP03_09725 [Massilia sp.]|nr:hypothetical protein [Massilia sp.]
MTLASEDIMAQANPAGAGQPTPQGEGPSPDGRAGGGTQFLLQAMQDALAEIQVCELAIEKSGNDEVKTFAQAMVDEHGRMGRDIEQLARRKGLGAPQDLRPEQEMTVEELSSLSGRDFEQRWIQYNIDAHERDIKVFRHYAGEEPDPDIRTLATTMGETLAEHLKMAHELGKKLAQS